MQQKKWKFNIVDFVIIAVLIAGIAFVGIKVFGGSDTDASITGTYHVTFFAEEVPEVVADYLEVGKPATNQDRNVDLGTVIDIQVNPSVSYVTMPDGTIAQSSKPGYCSITLVCELSASQQSVGIQVGNHILNVGHEMSVRNSNGKADCYIYGIELVSED